jgi:hypothetical protein
MILGLVKTVAATAREMQRDDVMDARNTTFVVLFSSVFSSLSVIIKMYRRRR